MHGQEARARVVEIARAWLGTPYHPAARVKGAGVDCLTLLAEVYHEAGIVPFVEVPYYPHDWHLHRGAERYLDGLLHYANEIESLPRMGDIALWRFGRCFSHGAIVVEWPVIIHAYVGRTVQMEDVSRTPFLCRVGEAGAMQGKARPVKFFSPWK